MRASLSCKRERVSARLLTLPRFFRSATGSGGFGGGFGGATAANPFATPGAAAPSAFGGASAFGAAPQQPSLFGAAAAAPAAGTRGVACTNTTLVDGATTPTPGAPSTMGQFTTIVAMPAFQNKSPEELRYEDYAAGVKGSTGTVNTSPQGAAAGGMFGAKPAGAGGFGAPTTASAFGAAPQASPFGTTTSGGFGASPGAGGGFGAPAGANPFGGAPTGGFGAQPTAGAFGATTGGGFGAPAAPQNAFGAAPQPFGAAAAPKPFGATTPLGFGAAPQPAGGLFGAAPAAQPFGAAPAAQPFGAAPAAGGGMFGATLSGGFGASAAKPAAPAGGGFFGASPGGGFGAATTAPAAGGGLFGGGGGMFGAPAQQQQGGLGGAAQPFGSLGAPAQPFGAAAAAPAPATSSFFSAGGAFGSSFGASPAAGSALGGAFGAAPAAGGLSFLSPAPAQAGAVAATPVAGASTMSADPYAMGSRPQFLGLEAASGADADAAAAAAAMRRPGSSSRPALLRPLALPRAPRSAAAVLSVRRRAGEGFVSPQNGGGGMSSMMMGTSPVGSAARAAASAYDDGGASAGGGSTAPESYVDALTPRDNPRALFFRDPMPATALAGAFSGVAADGNGNGHAFHAADGAAHSGSAGAAQHHGAAHEITPQQTQPASNGGAHAAAVAPRAASPPPAASPAPSHSASHPRLHSAPTPPAPKAGASPAGGFRALVNSVTTLLAGGTTPQPGGGAAGGGDSPSLPARRGSSASLGAAPGAPAGGAHPDVPRLTLPGYTMHPDAAALDALVRADPSALRSVPDFRIELPGVCCVRWLEPVDVAGVDLDRIVKFEGRSLAVYYDEALPKPPRGKGLNVPAEVTLFGMFKLDKATGRPLLDAESKKAFRTRLERATREADSARFKSYDDATGAWCFTVQHFSRYGLLDESDDEDEEMDLTAAPPPPRDEGGMSDGGSDSSSDGAPLGLIPRGGHAPKRLRHKAAEPARKAVTPVVALPPLPPRRERAADAMEVGDSAMTASWLAPAPTAVPSLLALPLAAPVRPGGFPCAASAGGPSCGREGALPDAGLALGRGFRPGWGPDGRLFFAAPPAAPGQPLRVTSATLPAPPAQHAQAARLVAALRVHRAHSVPLHDADADVACGSDALMASDDVSASFDDRALDAMPPLWRLAVAPEAFGALCHAQLGALAPHVADVAAAGPAAAAELEAEASLWQLLQALHGRDGPACLAPAAAADARLEQAARRAGVAAWLRAAAAASPAPPLPADVAAPCEAALAALASGRPRAAAAALAAAGDARLAALVAQAGAAGGGALPALLQAQRSADAADAAAASGASHVAAGRATLLALLAGDACAGGTRLAPDWRRALGLHLWYAAAPGAPLSHALAAYAAAAAAGRAVPPAPLYVERRAAAPTLLSDASQGPVDACFLALAAYARAAPPAGATAASLLSAAGHSADPLAAALGWRAGAALAALGALPREAEAAAGASAADAAAQVALQGGPQLAPWAVWVALCGAPGAAARAHAFDLLCRRWPDVAAAPGGPAFLRRTARVPAAWLDAAAALWGLYGRQWPSRAAVAAAAAPADAAGVSPAAAMLRAVAARQGHHVPQRRHDAAALAAALQLAASEEGPPAADDVLAPLDLIAAC